MGKAWNPFKKYSIKRIYGPSLIEEGSYVGTKAIFIVFGTCNRWSGDPTTKESSICSFCDASFGKSFVFSIENIISTLYRFNGDNNPRLPVVLTGGEPSLHVDDRFLIELKHHFKEIHIETNGSIDVVRKYIFKNISLSPKQSIEKTKLKKCHEIKILYPFISEEITVEKFINFPCKKIYLQPLEIDGYDSDLSVLNRRLTRNYIINSSARNNKMHYGTRIHNITKDLNVGRNIKR